MSEESNTLTERTATSGTPGSSTLPEPIWPTARKPGRLPVRPCVNLHAARGAEDMRPIEAYRSWTSRRVLMEGLSLRGISTVGRWRAR